MEFITIPKTGDVVGQEPQSHVTLCANVPWDNRYEHVRKFANRAELENYLSTKIVLSLANYSFIDFGSLTVDVPYNQMDVYSCNYAVIKNAPWDEKTHFAFVTGVEPMGANVCKVNFELDVWNECQFDMVLNQCFVEREIVKKSNDTIGRYTYPEEFQTGEIVVNGTITNADQIPDEDTRVTRSCCVASPYDASGSTAEVGEVQGVVTGIAVEPFSSAADLAGFITSLGEIKSQSVVDAWEMPTAFTDPQNVVVKSYTFQKSRAYRNLNGYTPKNNKLFCYPYNFIQLSNNSGQIKQFQYELFSGDTCQFDYTMNMSPSPTLYCYPRKYKGIDKDYGDSITFSNYPKIGFAIDAYKAWLAQNSNNLIISAATGENLPQTTADWIGRGLLTIGDTIGGALGSVVNFAMGNGGSAPGTIGNIATSASSSVAGLLSGSYNAQLQADGIKGSISNTLPTAVGFDYISVFPVSIRAEYARIIDNYFTMYGYKICRVKKPDISSRSSWNYVKTQNCTISGNVPINLLGKLRSIFDSGVTVWHTNDIGNYSLENN